MSNMLLRDPTSSHHSADIQGKVSYTNTSSDAAQGSKSRVPPGLLADDPQASPFSIQCDLSASASGTTVSLAPATDSGSATSAVTADVLIFPSVEGADLPSSSIHGTVRRAGHLYVHKSSSFSSGGAAAPQYLSSNSSYIKMPSFNVGPTSSSASASSNFHTNTSNSTNNVSLSPDLWSQQHPHIMNPTASSFQLNSFSPSVPNWQAPVYSGGPMSHDGQTYHQREEDELDKTDSFSYLNESRDSSNTIGELQRQQHHLSSTASLYSSHTGYPMKGYDGEKVSPAYAMPFTPSHHFMQQQQQNPLYSRTSSSVGYTASFPGSTSNKLSFGSAINSSAASDSSVLKHESTANSYALEDLTFGEVSASTCGDRILGYGGMNANFGVGVYNPYSLEGAQTHQQHVGSQFGPAGAAFCGQQHYPPSTARFDDDEFSSLMGSVGNKGAINGTVNEKSGASATNFTGSNATLNVAHESSVTNMKCPWGRYSSMQVVQEDMGLVSEGSTEASSSAFSSTDVSGGFWHSGNKSIHPGLANAACFLRGGNSTDLISADFSRQDLSLPLHPGLNSRSLTESMNTSIGAGKVQHLQHSFVSNNGASGQLLSSSSPLSSMGVHHCESHSSLQLPVMEDQTETPSDVLVKEQVNSIRQVSQMSEAPLPPLMPLENLTSSAGSAGKAKYQHDSVVPKHQTKKDCTANITVGNSKKSNRVNKVTKSQKPGNKLNRKSSSEVSSSPSPMVPPFRGSTSSLAVAASMLPNFSSFASSNPDEDLRVSSLRLNDDSPHHQVSASSDAPKQQHSLRPDIDRPILPSSSGGKKFYPNSPDFLDGQTVVAPSHYSTFYEDGSQSFDYSELEYEANTLDDSSLGLPPSSFSVPSNAVKKRDWLIRMNRKLKETEAGSLDPSRIPIHAVMNAWAKTKSSEGAQMVEMWLRRVEKEVDMGNTLVEIGTKLYTMAVDAWAKSGEKGAATRAEGILQHMNQLYQSGSASLKPTTGIFNAVINAWARSGEKIAPLRAEQILEWMDKLNKNGNPDIKPDKYSYNTVIHAWAKSGGNQAAFKAQTLLTNMEKMYNEGNSDTKPDTITYNVVINAWAKSGGADAAIEAEKLLHKMHKLYDNGNLDVKPNVVTYGAVIDSWAKSGHEGAAARADSILANMIRIHQSDPIKNADLRPNTYVFNTVINAWAKSKQPDAASKAEEMLIAMGQLHACGIPGLKPDAFTYTAVIDAWAKSGFRGAATRADRLLEKMELEYQAGDNDLKPNTFTYNAVINALAKSGEPGAAARAERVLHNMVKRHKSGNDDVKPTTINFNTVLDAFAKSGGKGAAERAEEILEWMDRLNKSGNVDVKPDTITFNAVIDAWARSGDRRAPSRAEQILEHMDELYKSGNNDVQPDTYTYNTVINAWAKSGEKGSASRAEHILSVMERRCNEGDHHLKPNTRTHTSVIDAWAKSGERGAAARAEHILNSMQIQYEEGNLDVKPNSHTYNAVMNACAFTKHEEDRDEAITIAFRVFERLIIQKGMHPDAYTYTILLSVCANLLPKDEEDRRFTHAKDLFEKCCEAGYVNDYVLRKLRQTVTEREYIYFVGSVEQSADRLPRHWTRNALKGGRGNQWVGNNKAKRK